MAVPRDHDASVLYPFIALHLFTELGETHILQPLADRAKIFLVVAPVVVVVLIPANNGRLKPIARGACGVR